MAAFVASSGKHKNLSYDHIVSIDPDYIAYLIRRRHYDKCPIFRAWWDTQPKAPHITFSSGKHKGKTYDEVWRTSPRYILKIYDRKKGKMFDQGKAWFEFHQAQIQRKRLRYATNGEELAVTFFRKYNIPFTFEFSLPNLPGKRIDFMFEYAGEKYCLEIDGVQHFKHTKYFHRRVGKFAKYQQTDIAKSIAAVQLGYHLIRIAFSDLPKLEEHLMYALQYKFRVYFSNTDKYGYIITHLQMICK